MPLYIEQNQIDLAVLSPHSKSGGRNYNGDNEIHKMIAFEWQRLVDKYNDDDPIIFVRPHMKSGIGQGSMGGSYQRSVPVVTRTGAVFVTWCTMARKNSFGQLEFFPKTFTHTPDQALTLTLRNDIEQILWHVLFDPLRKRKYSYPATDVAGKPHPMAGRDVSCLYIFDGDDDAKAFILSEAKRADLHYFILSSMSPFAEDREGLNMLASAWGVFKPEQMTDFMVKRELYNAVELREQHKDADHGYEAFIKAAKEYTEKGNTYHTEMLALVNRALDRGVVKWYVSKLSIELIANDGTPIKRLCTVPASKAEQYKEVLADYLIHNEDDLTAVKASVEAIPIQPKAIRKYYIPDPPTKEFFLQEMTFPEMRSLAQLLGYDIRTATTKAALAARMIDHFITQGKTLEPHLRAMEPPAK